MNHVPGHFIENYLLYAMPSELPEKEFLDFSQFLLNEVTKKHVEYLILDYSAYRIMDRTDYLRCCGLVKKVQIMGVGVINHGLNAGLVSTLVDLVDDFQGMEFAGSLEAALALVGKNAST
ncbi:hypothetical protein LNTAR_19872 [Lentisphaera araneosa HTCC2155]|jgi:hypothetical protein|uniref:STAS domain-containing protein n=1 Tax=Lentisphaera araneosa HTCC2155 TaxID=313628 RepID=A6DPR9_9BACT|nr:hypothetical protein [Lentisphaera araneosa]EDM26364.1 hypothetical protein LNTAR_19872 [Lentisphaera araneosa HTCC2155]